MKNILNIEYIHEYKPNLVNKKPLQKKRLSNFNKISYLSRNGGI